jgi:hypothetical protein
VSASPPSALPKWTALTTLLQLPMVVTGHYSPGIADLFAVGGTAISGLGGLAYGLTARPGGGGAGGGAIVGGAAAFLGILVSWLLGDVPPGVLAFGTAASAVAGALGGALGGVLRRRRPA